MMGRREEEMGARKGRKKPVRKPAGRGKKGFDTFEMAMMLRAIVLMQKSGVPLIDGTAAAIAGGFEGSVTTALGRALEGMRGGKGFAESLKDAGFPRLIVQVCAASEETGKLDKALEGLAGELERRLRHGDGKDLGGQARKMAHVLALTQGFGLPLVSGIEIAANDSEHPGLKRALLKVKDEVAGGGNFADALAKHPDEFGPFLVAYMRVGQSTGTLDVTLKRMARLVDTLLELQVHRGKSQVS